MRGLRRLMVFAAVAATPLSILAAVGPQAAQASPAKPAVKAGPAATTGTVEVCKSKANGMSGKTFQFKVTGLRKITNPVAVVGGHCSSPLTVAGGVQTITEEGTGLPAGDTVTAITANPSGNEVSYNLASRSAKITVGPGPETVVTFTNKVPPAQLKICKVAGTSNLLGEPFTFTENGGAPFSVTAGPASSPGCSGLTSYQVGTNVNVAEEIPANIVVSSIVVNPASEGSGINLGNGTSTVTLAPGVTVVTYTDSSPTPPSNGLLEICKLASDEYVSGTFTFTISAGTFTETTTPIGVNQCTAALTVPSGNVTVTETPQFPYYVSDVFTEPSNDLVTQNDHNGTAVVNVVASSSVETQTFFVNDTATAEVKICKTLTANSAALAGSTFYFNITSADGTSTESLVAGGAGTTVCQLVTDEFGDIEFLPIGSTVSITEQSETDVLNTSVVVSPSSQDLGSAPPTANLLVGADVTQATFTNEAESQIELCKNVTAYAPTDESFPMTVSENGIPVYSTSVAANSCTTAITIPAGTATVTETELPNFVLQGVSVSGSGSETSASGTSVTVTLPFAGDTAVTYTNTVATGEFKVCKATDDPELLDGIPFNFNWSYTANGLLVSGTANVVPGTCSAVQTGIPVVDQYGNPTQVTVVETATGGVYVAGITVSDGSSISNSPSTGTEIFALLPNPTAGITSVTYDNDVDPITPGE